MLKPEQVQKLPRNMVKLYAQAEQDILCDMARRISQYDYWIPSVEHQAKVLEEAGMVREEILSRLKGLTKKTDEELRSLMVEAGTAALKSDDEVYRRAGLNPSPLSASDDLQNVLQAGYEKTAGEFSNLTKTTALTATRQFEQALNKAYMQITMGGMDYNTVIRNTIKELSKAGVEAISYPSGRKDSLEVAVRRATVTGANQTALKLQEIRADEMDCDLVETSAHSGARPSHAEWQGGIYSRSGKSRKYESLVEATRYGYVDGLGGANCSHSFRPWFEGMSRTWSKERLEEYRARDFEYNGEKLTEYEVLQEQRKIERSIRRWKREENAMQAAGLDAGEAKAKVREWNGRLRDFTEQTGLKPDRTRTVVGVIHKAEELTRTDRKAIFDYMSSKSYSLNEKLRKGLLLNEDEMLLRDNLDKALSKMPKYRGTVQRSLYFNREEDIDDCLKCYPLGGKITYKEYLSTTKGDVYNPNGQIQIYIRESGQGRDVSVINRGENEVLYGRNSSFIVQNVVERNGKYYILLEEQP